MFHIETIPVVISEKGVVFDYNAVKISEKGVVFDYNAVKISI